jgi:hypothetical protein
MLPRLKTRLSPSMFSTEAEMVEYPAIRVAPAIAVSIVAGMMTARVMVIWFFVIVSISSFLPPPQ